MDHQWIKLYRTEIEAVQSACDRAEQIIALDAVPGEDEVLRALEVFHGSSCVCLRECWSDNEYDAMSAALTAAAKVRGGGE